jgi:transaldolase
MSRLLELYTCGQSYWLDNLSRGMIRSGDLKRRIGEEGLRGVTANPSTFALALKSGDYNADIQNLARQGHSTEQIYERLLVGDVQQACDLFMDMNHASDRLDGYVSLEVSPHLAHDATGTMCEARGSTSWSIVQTCLSKFRGRWPGSSLSSSCSMKGFPSM